MDGITLNVVTITLIANIAVLGAMWGSLTQRLLHLEKKQDKHNNLIERMVIVEQSSKSAHHRLDDYFLKKD